MPTKEGTVTSNPNKPLIPYLRQSRAKERTISIDEQRRDVERWAAANSVKLAPEVVEQGVSGSKPWRERALGEVIAACERGEASGVIVAWQDRLSRENGLATAEVWDALDRAGARLVCAAEGLDSASGDAEMLFSIKAAIAREQWKRYAANWSRAQSSAIDRGIHIGHVPIGYRRGPDRRLVVEPSEAEHVRELFELRAAGHSWGELAAYLDEHLPRPNGGAWCRQNAESLCHSRLYLGEVRSGEHVKKDAHDAIVTRAEWEAAQGTPTGAARRSGSLLSGILRCSSCGQPLVRLSGNYYGCHSKRASGVCAHPVQVSIAPADEYVEQVFLAWAREQNVGLDVVESDEALDEAVRALELAEDEVAEYRDDTELISIIGRDAWREGLTERARRVEDARATVAEAQRARNRQPVSFDLVERWPDYSLADRHAILARTLDAVICKPTKRGSRAVADRLDVVFHCDE